MQPRLDATVQADCVAIGWDWQGNSKFLDLCEIQVDRADGKGWALLTIDSTPDYQDKAPQPAALTRWTYRAIYHNDDARTGLWSPEVTAIVGGTANN